MGHALTAYLGRLKGYEYIADAVEDPVIRQVTVSAMKDLAICLCKQHGAVLEDANTYINDLLCRFENRQLQDTISRVGNDVKRKLSPRDRLVGAARLCVENGMSPALICLSIAAGISSLLSGSNAKNSCLKQTIDEILEEICEINRSDQLYSIIIPLYRAMESGTPLEDTIYFAAEMLNQDQKERFLQL
jgi:mannitol-1-phosphate 5-dehydrogenase